MPKASKNIQDYEILTAQMIADHQQQSRRKAYELMATPPEHRGIPCYNIGATKRVRKVDYLRWMEKRIVEQVKR
ncbi:hypothetical protein QFZ77_007629 [Paenibacillus sp. V4I3]|uniref:DNA-binding protein n=1 Tax=Paenibacillus sp. V4I3 TaxID=3042305 RepID=UPI002788EA8E|nr:DNA-binding protein [Paenibacillus sp. V4I3]MDQ0878970.1 hypothetical protein [Paenibacillus sp. V4I3]